jgi:hypothetical protein
MTLQSIPHVEPIVGRLTFKFDIWLNAIELAKGQPAFEMWQDDRVIFVLNMPAQTITSLKFEVTIEPAPTGTTKLSFLLYSFKDAERFVTNEVWTDSVDDAGDEKFAGSQFCGGAKGWEDVPGLSPLKRSCDREDLFVAPAQMQQTLTG